MKKVALGETLQKGQQKNERQTGTNKIPRN